MVLRTVASWLVSLQVSTVEVGLVWRRLVMQVSRTATCVGGRFGGDWRRSLLGSGEVVVGGMRLVVVRVWGKAGLLVAEPLMMLEELEGIVVVAVGVHRSWEGVGEAAVEGLALLEEVLGVAVVELAPHCDLSTLFSDIHARPPSTSRYCPGANGRVPFGFYFESDLGFCLPLA